jgi:hypothetical protein
MQANYRAPPSQAPAAPNLACHRELFLSPLFIWSPHRLDQRLVLTYLATIAAIVGFRDRSNALLLTELATYTKSPRCSSKMYGRAALALVQRIYADLTAPASRFGIRNRLIN